LTQTLLAMLVALQQTYAVMLKTASDGYWLLCKL